MPFPAYSHIFSCFRQLSIATFTTAHVPKETPSRRHDSVADVRAARQKVISGTALTDDGIADESEAKSDPYERVWMYCQVCIRDLVSLGLASIFVPSYDHAADVGGGDGWDPKGGFMLGGLNCSDERVQILPAAKQQATLQEIFVDAAKDFVTMGDALVESAKFAILP